MQSHGDESGGGESRQAAEVRRLADEARSTGDAETSGVSTYEPPTRSTSDVVGDLSQQVSRLVRDEVQLAMAETRTKGKRMGLGAGIGAAAGVAAFLGAVALVTAVILAIALVLPAWASALIVGGALIIAAAIGAFACKLEIGRAGTPVPEETISSVREDIDTVRGHASS